VFGKGVYFARQSSYSALPRYSKPNLHGQQFMIMAKVLVGHSTPGRREMLEPPDRPLPDGGRRQYDTLSGRQANGEVVVCCHDYQAYAEYHLHFHVVLWWYPPTERAGLIRSLCCVLLS
jgi:hypothetical protein